MGTRWTVALLLVAAVAAPRHAEAQDDARAQARVLFEEGVAHLAASEHEEAVVDLEAARDLYATASIHFNLGLAYRATRRFRDGIDAFERFIAAVGDAGDAQRVEEARRYMRTMRASLGRVRLDITPASARVQVDGRPIARGTEEVLLDPGRHEVVISAPGHLETTQSLEVAAGSTQLLQLSLESASHVGTLDLDVTPDDAEVRVDGRPLGTGDRSLDLSVGLHEVSAEYRGDTTEREVEILENERIGLALTVRPKRRRRILAVTITLVLLAAGGAATGIYLARNPSEQAPIEPPLGIVTTALGASR